MEVTSGAILKLFRGDKLVHPVVQLTDLKHVTSTDPDAKKKIKIQVSDGEFFGAGVLTSGPAALVASEKVGLNALVVLKQYMINTVGTTKMCIILDMAKVSEDEVMGKIGEPVAWDSATATVVAAAAEAPQNASPKPGAPSGNNTPHTANTSSRFNNNATPANYAGPIAAGALNALRATPIDALNPYSNKWLIKARVTNKGDLRSYNSARGEGTLFSFDLADESSEIRATCFKEVADRLFPMIEVGKTYLISKGQLKVANKKFSTLNNNYELTLNFDTQVQHCADEPERKHVVHYRFVSLADVAARAVNAVVDVIGAVSAIAPVTSLTSKAGKELVKRTLLVADDSGKSIELTLWGNSASAFPDDADGKVVAFKGLRVTEWNQKSLGASHGSTFEVEPENETCVRLKAWAEGGGAANVESLSQDMRGGTGGGRDDSLRLDTEELAAKEFEMSGSEPAFGSCRGYISKSLSSDDRPMWYSACPKDKCNKKVVGDERSGFNCESCGWGGPACSYRYILPIVVCDAAGSIVMSAFNEQATAILGMSADDLKKIKDNNPNEYEAVFARAQWRQRLFRVRCKNETYNGITRMKAAISSSVPTAYAVEGAALLKQIAKYDLPAVAA